ncbi:hypothetical protein APS56_02750 [Pseudalgibacter alginicilyticus]|uniref:Restriction endonuclease n=1 Tax=Pseudalgibacter alginicilyticus TaxID=1736674 RepID=A0A0P0CMX9_9FLAO|nr:MULTISPECIES: hypothetical protein [Flavobacteriaceae]ALJ04135.1 hypothetical protein APS56_02750 [Pseudalgibacter alginicilyticus]
MNADSFIYSEEPYYQTKLFNLVGYSYSELKKEKKTSKYSRKEILKKHVQFKGNKGAKTKLELEDYLRNDFLKNYINNNKSKFNLDYFYFEPGVDEIKDGVTIGSLDIKVLLPTNKSLTGDEYFAIECKRINKLAKTKKYYIDHGVNRFLTRQYYPESNSKIAFMLSFMECEKPSHREDSNSIVMSFNELLDQNYQKSILCSIGDVDLDVNIDKKYEIDIYNSYFRRDDGSSIQIYHIFLDYYDIIDI